MRFSTKSALAIIAVYFTILGVVALWMDRELRSISDAVLTSTAHLLGREIGAALTEPTLQQVLNSDPAAIANLKQIVRDVTERSQLVTSMLVVDASGTVLAVEGERVGRQVALPRVVFGDDPRPRFLAEQGFTDQSFLLFVPLLQQQNVEGYLRLSLRSTRLSKLHDRARRELLVAGGAGFLAVVVLSLVVYFQLSRVGTALTSALQAAIRGETIPVRSESEFAPAFEIAQRVGQELTALRERGSQALRRLGSLMQVMDVGVILLTPEGELEFANQRARELLGAGNAGAWEAPWQELRAMLLPRLAKCPQNESGGSDIEVELRAAGRANRLRLEIYRREEEGGEYILLVKSRETLEALESELRLAIQMRGFARFYMAFAHDLKAPLNAMVMNLELLRQSLRRQDGADDRESDRSQRYVSVLGSEITRLDRYLQTLLRQAAPPSTAAECFDLCDLIHDLATLLGPQAKQQRVTLDTRLPDDPVPFSGHRDRLKQALLNIAINALEAMPDGGALTLELQQMNGEAHISVTDSGPGIPPELLKEIYRMHFTTKDGGTGIGLYVARSVVDAYGGRIKVHSTSGRGTRFEVTLPVVREE
jgi:signal transduction histidine kinase